MTKWAGVLSTTEPYNYLGLLKVRQSNKNSEIFEFTITENGLPYNLSGLRVFFCTRFEPLTLIEKEAKVMDAKNGRIQFVMDEGCMQKNGKQEAYFEIFKEDIFMDSTQDFKYTIQQSIEKQLMDGESYIQRLEEILEMFKDQAEQARIELENLLEEMNRFFSEKETDFNDWFESVKDVLESIDPGGLLLNEIITSRNGEKTLNDRLNRDYENAVKYTADHTLKTVRLSYPKKVDVTCSGNCGENKVTVDNTDGLSIGDKIGIASAGSPKNNANLLIVTQGTATVKSDVSIFANADEYIFTIEIGDTKESVAKKIKQVIPFRLLEQLPNSDNPNRILFTTDEAKNLKITIQGFQGTGITISHVEDNYFLDNYLRTEIISIDGSDVLVKDILLNDITDCELVIDHTDLVNEAIAKFDDSDGILFIDKGEYNILGKISSFLDKKSIKIVGKSHESLINLSKVNCKFQPYIFSNAIYYYPDGQGFMFSECSLVKVENLAIHSKEYGTIFLRGSSSFLGDNLKITMDKAKNMNHTAIGVYEAYKTTGQQSKDVLIRNSSIKTHGMAFISLIDFEKTNQANKNINFEHVEFVLDADTDFDDEKIVEHVKIDTNTANIYFNDCMFDGGDLSSITLEEGTRNVKIKNCEFLRTNYQTIRIAKGQTDRTVTRVEIDGCYFANFVFGIRAEVSSDFTSNILVISNCIVDSGIEENTSTFAHLSNVNDLIVRDIFFLNSGKMKSSPIIVQNSRNVYLENIKAVGTGNIDTGQIRVINSNQVNAKDLDVVTLFFEGISKGSIANSNIRGRLLMKDNLDIDISYNKLNSDNYQTIANYYPLINLQSTKAETENGKYTIDFNKLYSTFNAQGIVKNKDTIIVNEQYNIKRGIRS